MRGARARPERGGRRLGAEQHRGGEVRAGGRADHHDAAGSAPLEQGPVDSAGNVTVSDLVARGDTWTYQGDTTRSTVKFSDDHHVQTVVRERTDDGTTYRPSMKVTLIKVD